MLRALVFVMLTACGDGSRKVPSTSGGNIGAKRFEPNCHRSFAPKPDRDAEPMCLVPAAEFTMGTPAEPARAEDGQSRRVRISKAFYIDQYEVTNARYLAFLRAGGHACGKAERYCFAGDSEPGFDLKNLTLDPAFEKLPVAVTATGAEAYCAWAGKRLPTDAEWELAARFDPGTGEARAYPWGDTVKAGVTNHFGAIEPRRGKLAPVGTFPEDRSAIGAFDMGGNSAEWVADCYALDMRCSEPCVDPLITEGCATACFQGEDECFPARVLRGGHVSAQPLPAKTRSKVMPIGGFGFRCAR